MIERWTVTECPVHGIRSVGYERCPCQVGAPFEVVRAAGARSTDPDTSKLAALKQAPRSGSQRARILSALRVHGPMTSREIEERTGISGAWKRVSELRQGGHIYEVRTVRDPETRTDVTVYAAFAPEPFVGSLF